MTLDSAQAGGPEHPGMRLARRLAETMKAEYMTLLGQIARDGDVDLVRALYDAGLLADVQAKSAVLPLPQHATDRMFALDLVRQIISIDGDLSAGVMTSYFASACTGDAIRTLGQLGGDPNQWMSTNTSSMVTPLAARMGKTRSADGKLTDPNELAVVYAMLDVLRERETVPMIEMDVRQRPGDQENLFQLAARVVVDGVFSSVCPRIIERILQTRIPDSWRDAAGKAVIEVTERTRTLNQPWQCTALANLLTIARFPGVDKWKWLLDASDSVRVTSSDLPYSLCNNNRCGANGVAAIANMLAHGVSPDCITVDLRLNDSLCRGTLLHSAIVQKNELMFNLLIDAGADAGSIVTAHPRYPTNPDVGLSAIALAEQYWNDVIPILYAKKARDAVMRTVDRAASARTVIHSGDTP